MSTFEYRSATIMSIDMVGFARLIANNTERTAQLLLERQRTITQLVCAAGGRVVDMTGDQLLAEFEAEDAAVHCAIAAQRRLAEINGRSASAEQLKFRIGLHSGRIVALRERIFGDPVNIASRLQSEAPSGGLMLSERVLERSNLTAGTADRMEPSARLNLKNIPYSVTAWAATMEVCVAE